MVTMRVWRQLASGITHPGVYPRVVSVCPDLCDRLGCCIEFPEPLTRINTDVIDTVALGWSENSQMLRL